MAPSARSGSTTIGAQRTQKAERSQQLFASHPRGYVRSVWWALQGLLEVVLAIVAFPLLILLVGLPVVLLIRLMIEIVQMVS